MPPESNVIKADRTLSFEAAEGRDESSRLALAVCDGVGAANTFDVLVTKRQRRCDSEPMASIDQGGVIDRPQTGIRWPSRRTSIEVIPTP